MPFARELTVRFHEIDRAGIVYFARVYEYCHVVFEDMLADALGIDLEAFFRTSTWVMPLVHSEADYRRPMLLGDRLQVELSVERAGASSLTFRYAIRGAADGELRASVAMVHACCDRASFQKQPLPPELVAGLARLGLAPGADPSRQND